MKVLHPYRKRAQLDMNRTSIGAGGPLGYFLLAHCQGLVLDCRCESCGGGGTPKTPTEERRRSGEGRL